MSMTAYGATQAREHARIPLIEALQTSYARREFFSPGPMLSKAGLHDGLNDDSC